jgi:hypothetical protein
MMEYKFNFILGLANSLEKLGDRLQPVELGDMGLTNSEYSNFPKLEYWDLVSKVEGGWKMTEAGSEFLRGRRTIHKSVWTYRGKVIGFDGKMITFRDVKKRSKTDNPYSGDSE